MSIPTKKITFKRPPTIHNIVAPCRVKNNQSRLKTKIGKEKKNGVFQCGEKHVYVLVKLCMEQKDSLLKQVKPSNI